MRGAVDPDFWDKETGTLQGWQSGFDVNLITLQHRYNQSRGECEQAGVSGGSWGMLGLRVTDEGMGGTCP